MSRRRRQADLKGGAAAGFGFVVQALFGSISGSARRMSASTGAITLPAIELSLDIQTLARGGGRGPSLGRADHAALMGAVAFAWLSLPACPITGIMAAAGLTALLYFVAVWVGINAYPGAFRSRVLPRRIARPCGTW